MTAVELGAEHAGVRAMTGEGTLADAAVGVRRRTRQWVRARMQPYAVACLTAAGAAAALTGSAGPVVWAAAGVVAIAMALELATARPATRRPGTGPVKRLGLAAGGALLAASSFAWLTPGQTRAEAVTVIAACAAFLIGARLAGASRGPRTVLVVGGRVGAAQLITQWASCRDVSVSGVCLPDHVGEAMEPILDVPVVGSLDDVGAAAARLRVDEVVVAPGPLLTAYDVRRLSWSLERESVGLSVVAEMDGIAPRRIVPQVIGHRVLMSVHPGGRSGPALGAKAVLDRVGAAVLLVLLAPVLAALAIMVRRDSPGPALFRQTRVGLDGSLFEVLKFRTMVVNAESMLPALLAVNEAAGPLFKMASDPRTTRIGRLLRSTSLDELPQLVNVVKGQMSLVGPRPSLPTEAMLYDEWIHRRLSAKPGMTGAWQVGGRSNLSWSESVRLDIDYVDNSRLRDDLWIAMRTARVVMTRDGAV
ncbi:exopolysaccharide biosynthesis polyprenyl glycosylphosphotransferase [Aeromicrobium wangtongii]|uniref:Exopolysaccharide biosynthesis polyprenyl glycosylphosphotransferase n=1 Tax=Aeromicrobium wangtongii TaxID=2969247 RepID=A0ABY5MB77_9ACTN|nr:exopolysaccharide biosynthesis polyprenyl glycosylphosphotransferase [Aeromicrobium wangtongii]MCD9196871.1 exopolysaccharide biosynthesis polyprenyl glycosylphosphotransferase [Aeromicrobium wangtongii]UUP14379.1 exopolysaccharide biosynthesis polyprenyl glycosylphosphotransferase [Aeromicrobium wangtongii]